MRHGEAECNLNHIIGGPKGCTGLTSLGNHQVAALADRLFESGELRQATALYSSVLPRAIETAERLRPVVGPGPTALGPVRQRCDLCELHPGEADGMEWTEMVKTFTVPDWDKDPDRAHRAGRRELERIRRAGVRRGARHRARAPGRAGGGGCPRRGDRGDDDRVPRGGAGGLPPGLGAHRACVHDRVGVGAFRESLRVAAFQRLLRCTAAGGERGQVPSRKARARASGAPASQASSIASRRAFLGTVRSCTRTAA